MAEEKLNTEVPIEENGTPEPVNGHEEASEPSLTLEKDEGDGKKHEDDGKKDDDDGKGDDFLLDESFFILVFCSRFYLVIVCIASGILPILE